MIVTAFYTFRMIILTFHGEFRGGVEKELEDRGQKGTAGDANHGGVHLVESPLVMLAPMAVLGLAAAALGYLANPQWEEEIGIAKHWITSFLGDGLLASLGGYGHAETLDFSRWIATFSTIAAVVGAGAALALYARRRSQRADPLRALGPVHTILSEKYYVDAFYENVVVRRSFYRLFAGMVDWLERNLIDGSVDLIGWFFRNIGITIGRLQTGQVQAYGTVIAFGALIIILAFLLA